MPTNSNHGIYIANNTKDACNFPKLSEPDLIWSGMLFWTPNIIKDNAATWDDYEESGGIYLIQHIFAKYRQS